MQQLRTTLMISFSRDLPISKELALSKPITLPDIQYRIHSTEDAKGYSDLSAMLR